MKLQSLSERRGAVISFCDNSFSVTSPQSTPNGRIVKTYAAIVCFAVKVIHLVTELHVIRQGFKSMSKASWNKKHALVFCTEFCSNPFQIGRTVFSQIHRYIHHRAARDPYQLGLRHRRILKMNASKRPLLGCEALVVLHKHRVNAHFTESFRVVCLHKITAMIPKDLRLNDCKLQEARFQSFSSVQHLPFPQRLSGRAPYGLLP